MGIDTGVDLTRLLALRARLAGWLPQEPLHGAIARAGLPRTFAATAAHA
jgi:hydroxymethylglutaryl-CoA lyase